MDADPNETANLANLKRILRQRIADIEATQKITSR
jgi:hypothetical protein